jgi:hypothetical protein
MDTSFSDSAFKQQRLPAWQPILTAGTVLPTFFILGVAFVPTGIGMLWFSDNVQEFKLDYTDCLSTVNKTPCAEVVGDLSGKELEEAEAKNGPCLCQESFKIEEDWEGEVYMYYGLTNFYQNHRRYVKSRDDTQLLGKLSDSPSSNCEPFDKESDTGPAYVPCGAIANSLFSGEIYV